jgi:hypothetical protein
MDLTRDESPFSKRQIGVAPNIAKMMIYGGGHRHFAPVAHLQSEARALFQINDINRDERRPLNLPTIRGIQMIVGDFMTRQVSPPLRKVKTLSSRAI